MVGKDGRIAHKRLEGKPSRLFYVEFGELVLFRLAPIAWQLAKLEPLWQSGIYMGHRSSKRESMVQRGGLEDENDEEETRR